MKSTGGKLLGDQPSGLQFLTMKGLTLLSALPLLLGRRPCGERLRRLDTKSSRDEFQDPTRPEMSGGAFAGVQTFRELFQMLDAKRALWGSQKRYMAKELNALINRVRTKNPRFHLPLEVIPETGGLRERVKALATAEALADERGDRRYAA